MMEDSHTLLDAEKKGYGGTLPILLRLALLGKERASNHFTTL